MSNMRAVRAALVLPFNVVVTVPAAILLLTRRTRLAWRAAGPGTVRFWLALVLFATGASLLLATVRMLARVGRGTLAPWDPTSELVVVGVYRHVRNPMISGVLCMLAAEAVLFGSPGIALWTGLFAAGNLTWMPLVEEPGLRQRFGDAYAEYARSVPRWIPRLTAWDPSGEG